ncbi:MAG: hypothetical protein AAF727_05440 [Pseudomonadota bacterium]
MTLDLIRATKAVEQTSEHVRKSGDICVGARESLLRSRSLLAESMRIQEETRFVLQELRSAVQ